MSKHASLLPGNAPISDSELAGLSAGKMDYSGYSLEQLEDFAKFLRNQADDALANPGDYSNYSNTVGMCMEMREAVDTEIRKRTESGKRA
jgi:hypothetical protein